MNTFQPFRSVGLLVLMNSTLMMQTIWSLWTVMSSSKLIRLDLDLVLSCDCYLSWFQTLTDCFVGQFAPLNASTLSAGPKDFESLVKLSQLSFLTHLVFGWLVAAEIQWQRYQLLFSVFFQHILAQCQYFCFQWYDYPSLPWIFPAVENGISFKWTLHL